jgi:hypothetical protein
VGAAAAAAAVVGDRDLMSADDARDQLSVVRADGVPSLPDGALLLHIGPHKTGTTAIQAALANGRPQLLRHGVVTRGASASTMRQLWR